ncbi:MAG TPA: S-layer homology domain-containing protein [Thermoanaerobaculia bacterium]|nr:S-layer homology domain-containing protein [Thermoanaerobaculia bacterium]
MKIVPKFGYLGAALLAALSVLAGGTGQLLGNCGPFTDVAADVFCPFVLEIFYLGITTGTTATTYDPTSNVSRLQMAAFLSRTVDGVLRRGSRRAPLGQFWTPQNETALGITTLPTTTGPGILRFDGADIWVPSFGGATVSRVRASDGKLLETWTGATMAFGAVSSMGRVFVTGATSPGNLYEIDPSQPAGAVTTVASNLGNSPLGLAFDGARFWTADSAGGSVSIVTPGATIPWTVTSVPVATFPRGILFDGANVWVTTSPGTLLKLDPVGTILQTVTTGLGSSLPIYDGSNIWVPSLNDSSITLVRASSGAILTVLTGNGMNGAQAAAFDGQRILVTNNTIGADSVSLWKAADLTPLGFFATGAGTRPFSSCSDGINFWILFGPVHKLARF